MNTEKNINEAKGNTISPLVSISTDWKLIGHSHQIADTGDYDGHYEITNGEISLLTKDDDNEALQPIVESLNNSGCKFYQDDWFEFENKILKDEITRLKFMIDNGLGWKDMENTSNTNKGNNEIYKLLGIVLNKTKCIIIKHKPSKQGRYLNKNGNYIFKWKCIRCGALLGLPHMTDKYIKKNYPMPPLPRRATDYKYQ